MPESRSGCGSGKPHLAGISKYQCFRRSGRCQCPGPHRERSLVQRQRSWVAENVADLHGDSNNLNKQTALNEKGEVVNGRGDQPNRHDILTGSQLDGTALAGDPATTTCGNWASSGGEGSAQVGHHDRQGGGANATSWNSAHPSKGCSQENLRGTGGDGFFYCFAE